MGRNQFCGNVRSSLLRRALIVTPTTSVKPANDELQNCTRIIGRVTGRFSCRTRNRAIETLLCLGRSSSLFELLFAWRVKLNVARTQNAYSLGGSHLRPCLT